MDTISKKVTEFQLLLEQAETPQERLTIRSRYHQYVGQLSDEDKAIAYQAAKPFMAKLVTLLKEEGEPLLQQTESLLERIRNRSTTPTL